VSVRSWARSTVASTRVALAAAAGVLATTATVVTVRASVAPTVGWIAAAAIWLAWTWADIRPMDSRETAAHATREDTSRPVSDLLLVAASVFSLAAVGVVLVQARSHHEDLSAALGVCSVAASWLVTHTVFTVRYAHAYYAGPDAGVDFNMATPPAYSDFAYLAFTIGMTYQVSDTDSQTPQIRAIALRHGLLSFLLGAVVLATTVNLVASLGG
jgi:uncharacterized membrane protein